MDRWDLIIIAAAGYVAVVTLVRLMAKRRNQLVDHVREQIEEQLGKKRKVTENQDQEAA